MGAGGQPQGPRLDVKIKGKRLQENGRCVLEWTFGTRIEDDDAGFLGHLEGGYVSFSVAPNRRGDREGDIIIDNPAHIYFDLEEPVRTNVVRTIIRDLQEPSELQLPGDCNQDGDLDISDGRCLLGHLFLGDPATLPCGDGSSRDPANRTLLDMDISGSLELTDAVNFLSFLFLGHRPPPLCVAPRCRGCAPILGCPPHPIACR